MDIKQEDLIRFWTYFGFTVTDGFKFAQTLLHRTKEQDQIWHYPNGEQTVYGIGVGHLLPITLETLYQYAIPKLQKEGYIVELTAYEHRGFNARIRNVFDFNELGIESDTPTEALFDAIMKIIKLDK
jgi:hypothetical protein